jgi:hypothetical protein
VNHCCSVRPVGQSMLRLERLNIVLQQPRL